MKPEDFLTYRIRLFKQTFSWKGWWTEEMVREFAYIIAVEVAGIARDMNPSSTVMVSEVMAEFERRENAKREAL